MAGDTGRKLNFSEILKGHRGQPPSALNNSDMNERKTRALKEASENHALE